MKHKPPFGSTTFLSVLEGLEGGFAIFSGILAGLIFTHPSKSVLISAGVIGILVSGFNSSAVKYSTEHYYDELDGREKKSPIKSYFMPAFYEFLVYAAVCFISLVPILIASSVQIGVTVCCVSTVLILFLAGLYRGKALGTKPLRDAWELSISGIMIIIAGALSGLVVSLF